LLSRDNLLFRDADVVGLSETSNCRDLAVWSNE
jgi:hypothetical protein